MESLFEKSHRKRENAPLDFVRSIMADIKWDNRLIGIRGARGTGKTTLLLQYMKRYLPKDASTLYVSLDNIWFSEHRLIELIDDFVKKGGKYFFADEVHKYPSQPHQRGRHAYSGHLFRLYLQNLERSR